MVWQVLACNKRAADTPTSAHRYGNGASPSQVLPPPDLLPPPSTKPKHYHNTPVDDSIEVLLKAFGDGMTTNDVAAHMLRAMLPGSLGPCKDSRDDLQKRACEIIGSELFQVENEFVRIIQQCEEFIAETTSQNGIHVSNESEEKALLERLKETQSSISQQTNYKQEVDKEILVLERELEQHKSVLGAFLKVLGQVFNVMKENFRASWQLHIDEIRKLGGSDWMAGPIQHILEVQCQLEKAQKALHLFSSVSSNCSTPQADCETWQDAHLVTHLKSLHELTGIEWLIEFIGAIDQQSKIKEAFNYFCSLRDDDSLTVATRKSLLMKTLDMFSGELNCEGCLIAGWESAALQKKGERGAWSHHVFGLLDQIMREQIEKNSVIISSMKGKLEEYVPTKLEGLRIDVSNAENQLVELERQFLLDIENFMTQKLEEKRRRVHEAEVAREEHKNKWQVINTEVMKLHEVEAEIVKKQEMSYQIRSEFQRTMAKFMSASNAVTTRKESASRALETFKSEVLKAYHWLLEHSDSEFHIAANDASTAVYDPDVREKIKILEYPLKNLSGRSVKCREMLFCSALSCLCPPAPHRRKSQADQCLVVGAALEAEETLLKQAVQKNLELIFQISSEQISHISKNAILDAGSVEDEGRRPLGENGLSIMSHLVIEAEERKQNAYDHHVDIEKALQEIQDGQKIAMQKYAAAVKALSEVQNAISMHFVPVKDSVTMSDSDAEQHIRQLCGLLTVHSDVDDCLLEAMQAALKHRPAHRGNFCVETIQETECAIENMISPLRGRVEVEKKAVSEWEAKAQQARRDVEAAIKQQEIAEQVCQLMRILVLDVKKLSDYRRTVLLAFKWLHVHGASESPMEHDHLFPNVTKELSCEGEVDRIIQEYRSLRGNCNIRGSTLFEYHSPRSK